MINIVLKNLYIILVSSLDIDIFVIYNSNKKKSLKIFLIFFLIIFTLFWYVSTIKFYHFQKNKLVVKDIMYPRENLFTT